jgi:hypothetical protein
VLRGIGGGKGSPAHIPGRVAIGAAGGERAPRAPRPCACRRPTTCKKALSLLGRVPFKRIPTVKSVRRELIRAIQSSNLFREILRNLPPHAGPRLYYSSPLPDLVGVVAIGKFWQNLPGQITICLREIYLRFKRNPWLGQNTGRHGLPNK